MSPPTLFPTFRISNDMVPTFKNKRYEDLTSTVTGTEEEETP
jgi:hypothetical protein